jgi:hypothetical protein
MSIVQAKPREHERIVDVEGDVVGRLSDCERVFQTRNALPHCHAGRVTRLKSFRKRWNKASKIVAMAGRVLRPAASVDTANRRSSLRAVA